MDSPYFLTIHGAAPPFEEIRTIQLPAKGYWLTFNKKGSNAFIALADEGDVIAIDTRSGEILARATSGLAPKRNIVLE